MRSATIQILKDLSFPEYRARHIFTAKLRLATFIGFWFLYAIFLKDYLSETKPVTITIIAAFILTTICYYNIFNDKYVVTSFAVEIFADLLSMTAIIYLTGGPESPYYIIYIFYAVIGGLFYNYRLAFLLAFFSFIAYALFLILCYMGLIPPLIIGMGTFQSIEVGSKYLYPFLLACFLVFAVYATKIAHYFTQIRERMLEDKNKELLALQQMSSTIRNVASLEHVLSQVIRGVLDGLGLTYCLLMLHDKDDGKIRCIPPEGHPFTHLVEEELGVKLRDMFFPVDIANTNEALKQIKSGKIIFRKDIGEIIGGLEPKIGIDKFRKAQEKFGIMRVIAIPIVTSRVVIGSLIGFTREAFVEAKKVETFQAFADQAALAIEAAMLISELRRKNIALIEANRVKSEFLATMSHELRTPLTAIIGFSELLLEGVMGMLSDEQKDSLKEVLSNGNNLLEMINNLLDLAKVDSGKMELQKQRFDWREMVTRVVNSVSPLIKKKNHTMSIETRDDVPVIYADEKRMQQIVMNLLSNAIKFTRENGRIVIATSFYDTFEDFEKKFKYEGAIVPRKDLFKNGVVVCYVEDSGIGIAKENLSTIFDVFQQVDSSVTRSYEGTGLGLALVKQFVELHGGFVWAVSEEEKGSTFTFVFPFLA